jgi:microcystin-dependent protein
MSSSPYVGQLALVPYNFAPQGWMFCSGQLLPIAENDVLFSLLGTTFGGDGQSTFGLPDLRGRSIGHQGTNPGTGTTYITGQQGGVEQVTLTVNQMPSHTHASRCSANAQGSNDAAGGIPAVAATGKNQYAANAGSTTMGAGMVAVAGGSQPHDNRQPYLVLQWIISLFGVYPSQG